MQIRWSPLAVEDLERIFEYISRENPGAARDVMTKLYDGCSGLAAFPYLGRVSRLRGRRELIFPGLPYVVVYQVKADAVEISRVYHGAQNWP